MARTGHRRGSTPAGASAEPAAEAPIWSQVHQDDITERRFARHGQAYTLPIGKWPPPPAQSRRTRSRSRLLGLERDLFLAAEDAAGRSDPIWSKFRVGAAVVGVDSSEIYTGGNFENDSYGLTICAERAAIGRAIAAVGPDFRMKAIAVYGVDAKDPTKLVPAASPSPCGACRQVIWQYGPGRGVDSFVLFPVRGVRRAFRMVDLLPEPFSLE